MVVNARGRGALAPRPARPEGFAPRLCLGDALVGLVESAPGAFEIRPETFDGSALPVPIGDQRVAMCLSGSDRPLDLVRVATGANERRHR